MSINDDLRAFILADSEIATEIDDRMYPEMIPQGAELPAIAYQTIATAREYHLRGQAEIVKTRTQLSIWAPTRDQADAIAALLVTLLTAYRGAMGDAESLGIRIVSQSTDSDLGLQPETSRYRALLDIEIQHAESQPA